MSSTTHPYYEAINDALLTDGSKPSAAGLTADRLYEDQLPNDPLLPGVRYALVSDTPHQRFENGDSTTAEIQFDVYSDRGDVESAWRIDRALRAALDRVDLHADEFDKIRSMCIQRGRPFREGGFYRIMSRYRLFGSA